MHLSLSCRFWLAVPVLCNLLRSVHAFAFNINGGQVGARRRGLDHEVKHSNGIALPQRAQVAMSAGAGSTWSWSQAAASALAAMQVVYIFETPHTAVYAHITAILLVLCGGTGIYALCLSLCGWVFWFSNMVLQSPDYVHV